jgi:glycosyltransferase involved in cell wall biosynthesis
VDEKKVQVTVRLLTDPDLNRRLRTAGRAWVEATYDWRIVYERVDAVYERLLEEFGGARHTGTKCGIIDP